MNFKPTLLKTIVSIVIGIIMGLLIGWQQLILPTTLAWRFSWGPFILFLIIGFIIIYVIWSLIEKKGKRK